jgi:hypothetical protein
MAWWQDGTSNQIIIGEKHIPAGKVGGTESGGVTGDISYLCFGGDYSSMGGLRVIVCGVDSYGVNVVAPLRRPQDFVNTTSIIFEETNSGASFGSWHAGICNFLIGDGSVRPIAVTTPTTILGAIAIVNDGQPVSVP